jgi:integrase
MVRQSLRTTDKREARRRLREREAYITSVPQITASDWTWDDAARSLIEYYLAYNTRDVTEAGYKIKRLTEHFGSMPLSAMDAQAITGYVVRRKAQGMANGTINIELMTLGRALRLAKEQGKLDHVHVPTIRTLRPASPRSGFFTREDFEAVVRELPDDLALVARIGYVYGWRVAGEVLTLMKGQVNLEEGTLRLEPGSTKNRDGRVVYLTDELKVAIAEQLARVKALERETGRIIVYLFPHMRGRHQGTRIKSIRRRWTTACRKIGLPGMLVHDLRRTACRNLVQAGISERIVMTMMGHRTRGMFDRYHIVSRGDLREATRKLSALSDKTRTVLGTADDEARVNTGIGWQ